MRHLVILAGGESRRFQLPGEGFVDKCWFPIDGKPMFMHILRHSELFDDVYIAAGRNADRYVEAGFRVLGDSARFKGPLAGIDSAVDALEGTIIFVPCDVPFITKEVLMLLLNNEPTSVLVLPNGLVENHIFRIESDIARGILGLMHRYGRARIDDILRLSRVVRYISVKEHDIDPDILRNINRRNDLSSKVVIKWEVFTKDSEVVWDEPPLKRALEGFENWIDALNKEAIIYAKKGLLSMMAHVYQDMAREIPALHVIANMIIRELINEEK